MENLKTNQLTETLNSEEEEEETAFSYEKKVSGNGSILEASSPVPAEPFA